MLNQRNFNRGEFDMAFSKDAILFVSDKCRLWENVYRWLGRDGRLVVTDLVFGKNVTDEFKGYCELRGYHLSNAESYRRQIEGCGFNLIDVEDISEKYLSYAKQCFQMLSDARAEYEAVYGCEWICNMKSRWRKKIEITESREQEWICIVAEKTC